MNKEEAKNYGFIARMNNRDRVPFHDKKFFDRVSKEKPEEGNKNEDWATLFDSWLAGWDEAHQDYRKAEREKKK
jgi:hypothetical protein